MPRVFWTFLRSVSGLPMFKRKFIHISLWCWFDRIGVSQSPWKFITPFGQTIYNRCLFRIQSDPFMVYSCILYIFLQNIFQSHQSYGYSSLMKHRVFFPQESTLGRKSPTKRRILPLSKWWKKHGSHGYPIFRWLFSSNNASRGEHIVASHFLL